MRAPWMIVVAVSGTLALGACGSEAAPAAAAPEPERSHLPIQVSEPAPSGGPNYSRNQKAGARAAEAADPYVKNLEADPTFGGLAIVPAGLRVDVVGTPSPVVSAAVTEMEKTVPVFTRSVPNSYKDLLALTAQLNEDSESWRQKGVNFSSWGPSGHTNTVRMTLTKYKPEFAQQLIETYGSERFSVSKRSETNRPMS
ncbi:hypothetical protein LWF15_19490 [Kineosporia rhizophila]|uniref:hypothetical protein n=1 Tax=Kineosporia TaxID=49184 RepID=UPI001E47FF99|nr:MULTISPECIES: hypothetical protein [Kineosporia]MCE0537678.1 hypothetical protein [Kineosporia rhizophila]GLY18807.1 hypothetical protein Kisp01_58210 [Kineosporia sp. NBRC 101677]